MGLRYGLFGCGVGEAILSCLGSYPDTESITLWDKNMMSLDRIRSKNYHPNLTTEYMDVDQTKHMDFTHYDVIISALPAAKSPKIARFALRSNTGFCDLGGVLEVSRDLEKLSKEARRKNLSIVPDNGIMPGLGMIVGEMLRTYLPEIESLDILVGGMPQRPKPPANYTMPFHVDGLRHLCQDPAPILRDGKIIWLEPMSEYHKIELPILKRYNTKFGGTVESFITSGAATTPWNLQKKGLKYFAERTIRWYGFKDFVSKIPPDKFNDIMLKHCSTPIDKSNPDFLFMRVTATNRNGTVRYYDLLDEYDNKTELSAMKRTTGFPTAAVARMIAMKKTIPGTNTPDCAIPRELLPGFMEEMRSYFNISKN